MRARIGTSWSGRWVLITVLSLAACGADVDTPELDPKPPLDAGSTPDAALFGTRAPFSRVPDDADAGVALSWMPWDTTHPYEGRALSQLVESWVSWHLSNSDCENNPYADTIGTACSLEQEQKSLFVFNLEAASFAVTRAGCSIPRGAAILVPLIYFIATGLESRVNQLTNPHATDVHAELVFQSMRDLHLTIDDAEISQFHGAMISAKSFMVDIAPAPNYFSCSDRDPFEGTLNGHVSGYFVLLPPGAPGIHKLRYGGTYSDDGFDIVSDVTLTMTIID